MSSPGSIFFSHCHHECGCTEATGPWPSFDAAADGICGWCADGLCRDQKLIDELQTDLLEKANKRERL